jgi:hypothetical protein
MILIFEGADHAGKTTIAKAVSVELGIQYFKKPGEQDAFKGTYNPEYSLIYETRKFLEYYEQNVIKDVVIDRDFPSEFVYGPIFRKSEYDRLEIEKYIWEYDKKFLKNRAIIVYCHKTTTEKDEIIPDEKVQEIKDRYGIFLDKTVNRVIALNTTDENLDKQVCYITSQIKRIKAVDDFNGNIYKRYSQDQRQIYFPGSFSPSNVLLVGQNPGSPDPKDEQSVRIHRHKYEDYYEFLVEHELSYRKSKYWLFASKFLKEQYGMKWNCQFAFTNVVKFSKPENEPLLPNEVENDKRLLVEQLKIFNPKKIISFGRPAHQLLVDISVKHDSWKHPSAFHYTKTEKL